MIIKLPITDKSLIILGYLNFILLTPLISIILGIINLDIPANLVTTFLNLVLIFFAKVFYYRKKYVIFFLFGIILITYLIYFSSLNKGFLAGQYKFKIIIYNIIMPIVVLFIMGNTKLTANFRFLLSRSWINLYIRYLSFLFILLFVIFKVPSEDGRPILPGMENTIWLARVYGTLLILSFISKIGIKYGFFDFIFNALLILIIYTISSRGVIISTILVLFILFWNYGGYSKFKKKMVLILLIGVMTISLNYLDEYFVNSERSYSIIQRLDLFEVFRSNEIISILGNGLGSFGQLVLGLDERDYPHNYFLEYLFEFGIIGLIFSFVFIIFLLKNINKSFVGYIGLYFFLGSLSSGDIPGNSFYYLSLFVLYHFSKDNYKSYM